MHPSLAYTHRLRTPVACLRRAVADPRMIASIACLYPSPAHSRRLLGEAQGRSARDDTHRLHTPIACVDPSPAHSRRVFMEAEGGPPHDYIHRLLTYTHPLFLLIHRLPVDAEGRSAHYPPRPTRRCCTNNRNGQSNALLSHLPSHWQNTLAILLYSPALLIKLPRTAADHPNPFS